MLGQCASLAHLNLDNNNIRAEGAGRLVEVLEQCTSLAHLDLDSNNIGAEGVGKLVEVLDSPTSILIATTSELRGQGGWRRCWGNAQASLTSIFLSTI